MVRIGLKSKMIFAVSTFVVILLAAIGFLTIHYFQHRFAEQISRQQFNMVSDLARSVDGKLISALNMLQAVSRFASPDVAANHANGHELLDNRPGTKAFFDNGLYLFAPTGILIASSPHNPEIEGKNFSFRDYFKQTLATQKPQISDPFYFSSPHRHPSIMVTMPVFDSRGKLLAVIGGSFDLTKRNFLSDLAKAEFGETGYFYLFNSKRTIIMHRDTGRIMKNDVQPGVNKLFDRSAAGFEGTGETVNARGVHLLASFKRLETTDWILAANLPTKEAYEPIRRAQRNLYGVLIGAIFISITVVWLLMEYFTRPLLVLTRHVQDVPALEEGDKTIQIRSSDEVGNLATAFNHMVQELDKQKLLVRDQKEFAESLLQNAAIPLFVLDADHRVIAWNRACEELTGVSATEIIGTDRQWAAFYSCQRPTLADLVLDGKQNLILDYYATYTRAHLIQDGLQAEGWFPNMAGKDRYIFFDAAPVHNSRGELVAAIETLNDITERKIIEDKLRTLSRAVEQSANTIVITNLDGVIEYVNPKFTQVTGYTAEEAIGQNPRILKSDSQPPEMYRELWQTISRGEDWRGEFHNKRKDGSLFWENVTISPILDEKGVITHFLAIKEDITARKEVEDALRKSREELLAQHEQLNTMFERVASAKQEWEATMDCIANLIILADADGKVRRCNRAVSNLVGQPYLDIVGRDWQETILSDGMQIGNTAGTERELFHSASQRWFVMKIYPLKDDSESADSGKVIVLNDTTEIKKMTSELEQAYADLKVTQAKVFQQEKMASIGQLAAGVAHEINNPIGFVSSNLATLSKYWGRLVDFITVQEEQLNRYSSPESLQDVGRRRKELKLDYVLDDARQLIQESLEGTDRVRKIVQDLKTFSRVDEAECKLADINACLESTISIVWNEIKYKATLHKELGDIPQIQCFPQQLNQVFINLLVNASHAIDKQGEITLKTWQDGEYICISVADTGCGIPEEIQRKIFEPFFTTKDVGKGTGLGLSISYDIVKKHNGELLVNSTVGAGTTFTVRLPVGEGV